MYRVSTHPHRMKLRLDGTTHEYIAAAVYRDGTPRAVLLRAAILAADSAQVDGLALSRASSRTGGAAHGAKHPGVALRVCGECRARIVALAHKHVVPEAVAARALITDGLSRDWEAHVTQATQGDLWGR